MIRRLIILDEAMLEAKHSALLDEAQRRGHTGVAQLRLCFQLLSLSSAIDRDCATRLAPHGLSEGRFTVLFLLHGAGGTLPPHELAERARSEEHTSELQSQSNLVCRLLLEKKKKNKISRSN